MFGRRDTPACDLPTSGWPTRPTTGQAAIQICTIVLPLAGRDLCLEVKCRGEGFRKLYSWLSQRDVLIVKANRQEPLVVLHLSLAAEFVKQR
jgi:hypothetical protein